MIKPTSNSFLPRDEFIKNKTNPRFGKFFFCIGIILILGSALAMSISVGTSKAIIPHYDTISICFGGGIIFFGIGACVIDSYGPDSIFACSGSRKILNPKRDELIEEQEEQEEQEKISLA